MNYELGGKGGQRGVRKKWELETDKISRGAEPGVRGFEEDSKEMDGSEECAASPYS